MASDDLLSRFDALLAPYAVHNAGDHHRAYKEDAHPDKLPFARDRDRIVHSKAFRRLKHKTQVIVSPKDDHIRDRLTHSLEGAQIARSLCRSLRLNEDLAEAAILAHDLGHPPFGHEGEYALHEMLEPLGFAFDHNAHGERIVTLLEKQYPDFPGLNLTRETLAAIRKHHVPWEDPKATLPHQASIEAQIVNLADEIAYYSHDIDDGLRAHLLRIEDLLELQIGRAVHKVIEKRYPNLTTHDRLYRPQFVRFVIHLLIADIVKTTERNVRDKQISSLADVYALDHPVASYSKQMDDMTQELRNYLYKTFYSSEPVRRFTQEGRELLQELFTQLYQRPEHLPQHIREQIDTLEPRAIVVKDYIAGMTDHFAKEMVYKLRGSLV